MSKRSWAAAATVGLVAIVGVVTINCNRNPPVVEVKTADAQEVSDPPSQPAATGNVRVQTVKPTGGGMERTTSQPGSVYAYESAALFAKISG